MSQRIVIETHDADCEKCRGTGWRGEYNHVDPDTGEHMGYQTIPCENYDKEGDRCLEPS